MKKIIPALSAVISMGSFAQSLQCQLEREQLVAEYRQKQQSDQQALQNAIAMAQLTPEQRATAQLYMAGNQLGNALAGAKGGQTFEQRVQDWERRCGR